MPILFKIKRSNRKESKGIKVQEVSYSERWPGNINNDGGEKASPMVFDKMKELMVVYNT